MHKLLYFAAQDTNDWQRLAMTYRYIYVWRGRQHAKVESDTAVEVSSSWHQAGSADVHVTSGTCHGRILHHCSLPCTQLDSLANAITSAPKGPH